MPACSNYAKNYASTIYKSLISLDCTQEQINICHSQCIYMTIVSKLICIILTLGENTSSTIQVRLLTF